MKLSFIPFLLIGLFHLHCTTAQETETEFALPLEKIVIDSTDTEYGYYLQVPPQQKKPNGVLVLFPGLGQVTENIFTDTKLPEVAYQNGYLTIGFAGRARFTADPVIQDRLNLVLNDVLEKNEVQANDFVLGGFSAGGTLALRYTELCYEFPDRFPIQPKGVFMADAPIDMYHIWALKEQDLKNEAAEISMKEAQFVERIFRAFYKGVPSENPELFVELSPFSINEEYGTNERFLKDVAVRAYHDVDIAWRLKNRNQTVRFDNYVATSELINRLLLLGNERAEFVQTFQTGYRKDGKRHPHSWSIIDEEECIQWMGQLLTK